MNRTCPVADISIGTGQPLAIIGGPCTLESFELGIEIGETLRDACARLGLSYVFKASFDKANRTSAGSPRGPGIEKGLDALAKIGQELGTPITTDIHDPTQAAPAAEVVDIIQLPAFLCRQTDLLEAAGREAGARGKTVNIKKGQFLSPAEMKGPVSKVARSGCDQIILTERGTFFGYHRLVNDFIGIGDLMELEAEGVRAPVCFDCTHSTQLPGASATSGGQPERAPLLARAAVAAGVDAIFLECHPDPTNAVSDAATMLLLKEVPALLEDLARIRECVVKSTV